MQVTRVIVTTQELDVLCGHVIKTKQNVLTFEIDIKEGLVLDIYNIQQRKTLQTKKHILNN